MPEVSRTDTELNIFAATIYAEARGEPEEGQIWVAWVIKNRANLNKSYWGGSSIKGICLAPGQFECWNGLNNIYIDDMDSFYKISELAKQVSESNMRSDPTFGCDHYNNPQKERCPDWTKNCTKIRAIHNHQFYRTSN